MNDLHGLDWSAASNSTANKVSPGSGNYYPSLRPTPPPPQISGRSTPLFAQPSGAPKTSLLVPPKSSTPDSFSNLVSFGSSKTNTLTLQEQQEKLQVEKRKQEADRKKQYDSQFGNAQFWDGLGSTEQNYGGTPPGAFPSGTLASRPIPSSFAQGSASNNNGSALAANRNDDDLFAAFNADTKVDKSSHYPPPLSTPGSGRNSPGFVLNKAGDLSKSQAWGEPTRPLVGADLGDDDDPFGLGKMKSQASISVPAQTEVDDDDFLGDLAKPVEEVRCRSPAKAPETLSKAPNPDSESDSSDPWDKAVAELVDMGFSAEQSRRALTESGAGLDIQAAVGWILNDAHRQAKQKVQHRDQSRGNSLPPNGDRGKASHDGARREGIPAWLGEDERDRSRPRREDSRSPGGGETDLSKAAAAVGSNLFKTANSLWKISQKKVQKTVAEFQQESDSSQPKWMREAAARDQAERNVPQSDGRGRRVQPSHTSPGVTDEALMLEGGSRPPPRKVKASEPRFSSPGSKSSRDHSPALPNSSTERSTPVLRWQQTAPSDPRSRISKQAVEEQSAQAYISPARRKKATPQPKTQEPDSPLFSTAVSKQLSSRPPPGPSPPTSKPSAPLPVRAIPPPRTIPHLSPIALSSSTQHRLAGTTQFKRGDYAAAHASYTSSLTSVPANHPLTIILLCNRALTSLKTGIPKEAVSDADAALSLIGPSRGADEVIDLGTGEAEDRKNMKEFWGKALMRKAEALEQMERWKDAADVWRECVEGGLGGATAIQGRQRCEKALAPKPPQSASAPRTITPKPKPKPKSALHDLGPPATDSEAVERLRAANKAAERADDEKFALADKVEERISNWRDGKRDNLRALLGSLDQVLWEGSGWKKVGMHELVVNSKVKIYYMKAIGKCHPDKLPQDASIEVKLIAATVFATLNESWDSFKQQNGM